MSSSESFSICELWYGFPKCPDFSWLLWFFNYKELSTLRLGHNGNNLKIRKWSTWDLFTRHSTPNLKNLRWYASLLFQRVRKVMSNLNLEDCTACLEKKNLKNKSCMYVNLFLSNDKYYQRSSLNYLYNLTSIVMSVIRIGMSFIFCNLQLICLFFKVR